MTLPTRDEMLRLIRDLDRPGRLTLVEGAGGLLVELADAGVTLRDLAADLGAAGARHRHRGIGHAQPHRADPGIACWTSIFRVPDW